MFKQIGLQQAQDMLHTRAVLVHKVAFMIYAIMKFRSTFGGSKLRPGEHRQAQVDSRGVR